MRGRGGEGCWMKRYFFGSNHCVWWFLHDLRKSSRSIDFKQFQQIGKMSQKPAIASRVPAITTTASSVKSSTRRKKKQKKGGTDEMFFSKSELYGLITRGQCLSLQIFGQSRRSTVVHYIILILFISILSPQKSRKREKRSPGKRKTADLLQ